MLVQLFPPPFRLRWYFVLLAACLGRPNSELQAATVADKAVALTAACEDGSLALAQLPAGSELAIRYSISGLSFPCFKVSASVGNKLVEGYIRASEVRKSEDFTQAVRNAGQVQTTSRGQTPAPASPQASTAPIALAVQGDDVRVLQQANGMIDAGQPARALLLVETRLKQTKNPALLTQAGLAAWRSDDIAKALVYWKESLHQQPNAELQSLYNRVYQESRGDQSNQRLIGLRTLLRYDGVSIKADTAREMVAVVDQEFGRIASELGCGGSEHVIAIAQTREDYLKSTGAAEWSGGQFDGRIHIPILDQGSLDPQVRQTLAHESVHACMAQLGQFPTWLAEGVAQKLSGAELNPATRASIDQLAKAGKLPSLNQLARDWNSLDTASARVAYALALRAVEVFEQDFSAVGLRNLLKNPERIPQIAADIDKKLGM